MATLKTCFKCGAKKARTEFYAHPAMGDGLLGKCKQCTRLDVRTNREKKVDHYRDYDTERNQLPDRKAQSKASFKRASMAHPERKRAANLVARAVSSGVIRKSPCWVCGERAEAHHPDYSAPLDVVWLCTLHHRQTHSMMLRADLAC